MKHSHQFFIKTPRVAGYHYGKEISVKELLSWEEQVKKIDLRSMCTSNLMKSRTWLDGEFGLGLYYRDLFCAVAGFNIASKNRIDCKARQQDSQDEDVAIIKQLQMAWLEIVDKMGYTVLYKKEARETRIQQEFISDLRWEKLLVKSVEKILRELGVENVAIQSAENNYYIQKIKYYSMENAKIRYNVTAKRLGYKLGEDGDFHKKL